MATLTPCTPDQIRALVDGYEIHSWQGYDCAMLKDGRIVLVCESSRPEAEAKAQADALRYYDLAVRAGRQKSSPAAKERAIREAAATVLNVVAGYLCRLLRGSD